MEGFSASGLDLGSLQQTAIQYRKDFLQMPIIGMQNTLQHMTLRPGIRYKEVVGELTGNMQFGPYSETRVDETDTVVNPRELETFLGSVVKNFSPNSVYQSLLGSSITKGEALKSTEVARLVVAFLATKLGKNLNDVIWSAVRNANGTTSKDLFNGFDTITAAEVAKETISADNGNYKVLTDAISSANAVDVLKTIYRSASDELREQDTKMFVSQAIYDAYVDDYQATVGSVPYNTSFDKTTVEGSMGRCEIVPLANKRASGYITLSTKGNMLVGVDQLSDAEKIEIEKYAPFVLTFVATMFFGCQFESVSKERLFIAKLA